MCKRNKVDEFELVQAAIVLKTKDCKYRTISLKTWGSPAFAGATLVAKYGYLKKVEELIKLGNLETLGESVEPTKTIYRQTKPVSTMSTEHQSQVFNNIRQVFYGVDLTVDFIYVFDALTERWTTYEVNKENGLRVRNIEYYPWVTNLIYRDDISDLTKAEKENLIKKDYKKSAS